MARHCPTGFSMMPLATSPRCSASRKSYATRL
jgi:hypothetical protein